MGAAAFRMGVLFLVGVAGWFSRRRGWLGEPATTGLGRICVDICFPALTFVQMLQIVGQRGAAQQGSILLVGAVLMTVALLGGWALMRSLPAPVMRTAWLAAAMPNWVFLPLPIATVLYGADGLATVLLVNAIAQFYLWTTSVGILRGFRKTMKSGLIHLLNPGLLATALGAVIAACWAPSRDWIHRPDLMGHALRLLETAGSLTIPLSMLVTGSQLGAIPKGSRPNAVVWRATGARLIWIPLITMLVLWLLAHGIGLPASVWRTAVLIAAMPVAISCGVLVERYGGSTSLVGQMTLVTTAVSLVTVPILMLVGCWLFP